MITDPESLSDQDREAYYRLRDILHATGGAAVAFSGGVDSSFLLDVARGVLGMRCMAIMARSPLYPLDEQEFAVRFARERRIKLVEIEGPSLDSSFFAKNPPDRCYHCKKAVFGKAKEEASRYSMKLADATNLDDLSDYRPGLAAASELEILSPLVEAGFDKARIRRLSKEQGLENWNAPSQACLATRIPHGSAVTEELLAIIYRGERAIKELGFSCVRVRYHNGLARVEVGPDELGKLLEEETRNKVRNRLLQEGFSFVTADLKGYRSGSMNPESA